MKKLHKKIRMLRKFNELSQENIAYELGLSQSQYSRRENGVIDFSVAELLKLCKIFNVNYEEILNPSDDSNEKERLIQTKFDLSDKAAIKNRQHSIIDFILQALEIVVETDLEIKEKEDIINSLKSRLNKY
ncbi:MAG: helix-turn-helix transcriptional regulator [Crocinitomicaceae bacterium]|nr:helix-turn-helix transcriptional regulator [Crocinitomicaceae bacterium]